MSRRSFYLLTALMGIVGLLLMLYQHLVFGVPFLPGEQKSVWSIEAKLSFSQFMVSKHSCVSRSPQFRWAIRGSARVRQALATELIL